MTTLSLECTRCNYKFRAKVMPKNCPYCSKQDCIALAKTAQDLLDEALSDFDEFEENRSKRQK